jgi:hypothetical protein
MWTHSWIITVERITVNTHLLVHLAGAIASAVQYAGVMLNGVKHLGSKELMLLLPRFLAPLGILSLDK